jgi:hypothetical protein
MKIRLGGGERRRAPLAQGDFVRTMTIAGKIRGGLPLAAHPI